mmetsp:Transcript_15032/g.27975  ORF Transcript_15032/g.27975 Transcript_15032/m.27975 type:complete len:454 (-) Transcript_15032:10036-11397(-)
MRVAHVSEALQALVHDVEPAPHDHLVLRNADLHGLTILGPRPAAALAPPQIEASRLLQYQVAISRAQSYFNHMVVDLNGVGILNRKPSQGTNLVLDAVQNINAHQPAALLEGWGRTLVAPQQQVAVDAVVHIFTLTVILLDVVGKVVLDDRGVVVALRHDDHHPSDCCQQRTSAVVDNRQMNDVVAPAAQGGVVLGRSVHQVLQHEVDVLHASRQPDSAVALPILLQELDAARNLQAIQIHDSKVYADQHLENPGVLGAVRVLDHHVAYLALVVLGANGGEVGNVPLRRVVDGIDEHRNGDVVVQIAALSVVAQVVDQELDIVISVEVLQPRVHHASQRSVEVLQRSPDLQPLVSIVASVEPQQSSKPLRELQGAMTALDLELHHGIHGADVLLLQVPVGDLHVGLEHQLHVFVNVARLDVVNDESSRQGRQRPDDARHPDLRGVVYRQHLHK